MLLLLLGKSLYISNMIKFKFHNSNTSIIKLQKIIPYALVPPVRRKVLKIKRLCSMMHLNREILRSLHMWGEVCVNPTF